MSTTQALAKNLAGKSLKGLEVQAHWDPQQGEPQEAFKGTGPGACYNEAYRILSRDEARQLCTESSSLETARCFMIAIDHLPKDSSIKLCQGAKSPSAVDCFRLAKKRVPDDQAMELCAQGGDLETYQCFVDASKSLSTTQALQLCSGRIAGAKDRLNCFRSAIQRFGVELALDQCDHT